MEQTFDPSEEVTLVVHSHGLWCSHKNQTNFIETLKKEFALQSRKNVVIYAAECNSESTTDGIIRGGERLAQEAYEQILRIPQEFRENGKKINLALTGHSLGGLYQRAMLPFLLSKPGIMDMVRFKCFMTLNTPNLGCYFYLIKNWGLNYLGGESGRDLGFYTDTMSILSDKEHIDALRLFDHRTLVAACWGDTYTPFCSASARLVNPYKVPMTLFEEIYSGYLKTFPPAKFALRGYSGFSKDQARELGMDDALSCDPPTVKGEIEGSRQTLTGDEKHWLSCNENLAHTYEGIFANFCDPPKREGDLFPEEHFWKRVDVSFYTHDKKGLSVHEMSIGKKQREIDMPAAYEAMRLYSKIIIMDTK